MSETSAAARDALYKYYLSLMKSALDGTVPPEAEPEVSFRQLYSFSAQNHTSHMLRQPLSRLSRRPDPETDLLLTQQFAKSVARDAEQTRSYSELVGLLADGGVSILPIKGIELKGLYPESHMRRMSDIDIVYDSHGDDWSVRRLMESLGYSCESWGGGHHDIFHLPPLMNIELHRRADYPEYFDAPEGLVPDEKVTGLYHLSPSDFYVLLLWHDAKHMRAGGLGVRAICDIYVLKKRYGELLGSEYVGRRLKELGLLRFAEKLGQITDDWFGGSEPVIDDAGRIILSGRTYGSPADAEMLRFAKRNKRSRLGYAASRIFPGYGIMKSRYSILGKLPFLLPVFWGVRGFSVVFDKKRRRALKTMGKVVASTDEDIMRYEFMLNEFGLN